MIRPLLSSTVVLTLIITACQHGPKDRGDAIVRTIEISDAVKPPTVYARTGEEIRWHNIRSTPVRVGFLSRRLLDDPQCSHGMSTLFGEVEDLVTIQAGESVALCPARSGLLQYNVWFEADNPRGPISRTGTIHVEAGS